jgi:NADPH-dependent 2,4-dienoyl-CoA reductase/sulfur reductase-like enzyme
VDRPNLSKDFLAGTAPMEWVTLRADDFYEKLAIELVKDDTVVGLDAGSRSLTLESGKTISCDALLLATGAEPVLPPIDGAHFPHVFTLRTLAHAQRIIEAATAGKRVVVVGSGFIGLEVAASLRHRNLEVQVVSRDDVPLGNVLGEQLGRFVQKLHEEHGVKFHLGATLKAIFPNSVELDDGRAVAADLVVLGIGVRPRTALAEKAGLEVDNGIVVDSSLRTSAPGIWAAGDVARYPESRLGTKVRIEHWVVAQRQGQAAAADMLGLGRPFDDVPFFWSQHYDVTLNYVGHAGRDASIEVTGNLQERDATAIYRQDGRRVTAVVTIGRDRQSLAVEAALQRHDEAAVDELLRTAAVAIG